MTTFAHIALGSNLGDRRAILDGAVAALGSTPGVSIRAVSSYIETSPVGGPDGQGPFLNAAAEIETSLAARSLLDTLQEIERSAGRVRRVRWGERTLDLDLLLFGGLVSTAPHLLLPHPRMPFRRFVLAPLSQIAPEAVHPLTGRSIRDLLANLDRRPSHVAILARPGDPRVHRLLEQLVSRLDALALPVSPSALDSVGDRWLLSEIPPPNLLKTSSKLARDRDSIEVDPRIPPTFLVLLDPLARQSTAAPDPPPITAATLGVPILSPDSSEPDLIANEIVSACLATRP